MKRIWGPLFVLAGGFCSVLPAQGEDLFEVPTVSPPTATRGTGEAGAAETYGNAASGAPQYGPPGYGVGVPPVVPPGPPRWQPRYYPPPVQHPLAPGPLGEPIPEPRGDYRSAYHPDGYDDGYGRTDGTCWINEQYEPEWYVAVMGGYHDVRTMKIDYEGIGIDVDPDGGIAGSAAAGWAHGLTDLGRSRFEVEFNVRHSDIDTLTVFSQPNGLDADLSSLALMANLYWDFKRPGRDWYPYIGAGVGGAHINFENASPTLFGSDELDDTVYAWQLMAGVSVRPRPWLELFAEGKYFHTDTIEISGVVPQTLTFPGPITVPGGERNFRAGYHTFGVMFGARILLGKRTCDVPGPGGRTAGGGWHFQPWGG